MMYGTDDGIYEEFDENTFNLKVGKLPVKNKYMEKESKFSFLTATRFWALVIGAVMFYLKSKGYIGEAEMVLANTILGGFIITKTVDRFGEQKVLAAKESGSVTTVSMPATVSSVTATTDKEL